MKFHFLNVGQGDCTIIEHDSRRITMVDINNGTDLDETTANELITERRSLADDFLISLAERRGMSKTAALKQGGYEIELTNPVEYFQQHFAGRPVFRFIQTHPDSDHLKGLESLHRTGIRIINFWDTEHQKVGDYSTDNLKQNWQRYEALRRGRWLDRTDVKVLNLYQGAENSLFNKNEDETSGGDGIYILAPTKETNLAANESGNVNNLSYVLMVIANGFRVLLGGDAEAPVWKPLFEHYGSGLKCDVLKASHHGRESGFYRDAVRAMSPELTIVSVGKKPSTDASNRYRNLSDNVYSTRWKGNIVLDVPTSGRPTVHTQYDR